jgi:hypothetical protein
VSWCPSPTSDHCNADENWECSLQEDLVDPADGDVLFSARMGTAPSDHAVITFEGQISDVEQLDWLIGQLNKWRHLFAEAVNWYWEAQPDEEDEDAGLYCDRCRRAAVNTYLVPNQGYVCEACAGDLGFDVSQYA